jgi:diguanylate cyclase (GGDEF)-like protein
MTLWTFTMSTMTMKQEHVIFMNTHIMTTSVTTISIDLTLVILILCLAYLIYLHHLKHCRPWDMLSAKLEKSNKQLSQLTLLDNLTKLPNRISLKNHIDSLIEISKQTEKDFFVLFIDIDDFKQVNDAFGHDVSDRLLRRISRRIFHNVRKNDFASRVGGDEFILIINDDANCSIYMIVNRLIAKLSQSYHFMSNLSITISVSIGISIFPADGVDANIIIKHAGAAMYKAKRDGKNGFCFYHNDSNT